VIGNYIFGLPEDTLDTMQATLDLALELDCEFANFYCTMAYPGSVLYQRALADGWPLPQDWGAYSQHAADCIPLPTRTLTGAEVLAFRDTAFQHYFGEPGYLSLLERTFGASVRAEVEMMTAQRLLRARTAAA
jgi:hypothetical protein